MNWIGSVSHRPMALLPVWKSVTGDQVTSTNEWANPVNKRLRRYSRRPGSPCGNAGIGRSLHIMGVLSGRGDLEPQPNSRPVRPRAWSWKSEITGIDWTWRNVQYNRASFDRRSREKA